MVPSVLQFLKIGNLSSARYIHINEFTRISLGSFQELLSLSAESRSLCNPRLNPRVCIFLGQVQEFVSPSAKSKNLCFPRQSLMANVSLGRV